MPGVIQRLRLELDQSSVKQLTEGLRSSAAGVADWIQGELEKVQGDEAGKKAGKELVAGLQQGFGADLDALRLRFQRGLINAEELQTQGVAAAKRFNEGIRTELQRFAANPAFVVNPFKNIATAIDPGDVDRLESSASAAGQGIGDTLGQATVDAATKAADFGGVAEKAGAAGTEAGEKLAQGVEKSKAPDAATAKGAESARAFVDAITAETRRTEGQVKIAQAQGLLSQDEAHRKGQEAAHAHNQGILRGIAEFRGKGELSPQVLGIFTDAFQGLGDKVPPPTFFDRVGHSLRSHLASWSATIVSFFAARQLFRFGEDAVRAFLADDKALQGLQTQVEATGVRYETLAGQIEVVQDRLARLGAASAGQVAQGIGQLIAVSGDADKSVRNIGLAADFAAKHHLTFEQAVELVGRAMIGQTRELRQYGIFVKAGDDAVVAMAKDAEGFASRQGPNLTRSVNMLSFAWHDLKAAIGESLVAAGGGTSTLDLLTVAIRDGVTWVRSHREEIGRWGAALASFARFLLTYVVTPIVQGFTVIIESFQDVGLTLEGLGLRFKFIGGAFAIIAANISDAWDGVLKKLGLWSPDAVADQTVARLRAWGERVQAEAVRQKEEIDKKLTVIRGEAPAEPTGPLPLGHRAAPVTTPSGIGGAVHPAGFGQGGAGAAADTLGPRIALLTKATQIESLRASALAALERIEAGLERQLARTNLPLEKRIALEEHLVAVQRARGTLPLEKLAPTEQLGVLTQTVTITNLRAESLRNLERLERQFTAEMNDGTKSLEFRAAAEEQLRKVQDLRGTQPFDTLPLEQRISLLTQATQLEQFRATALGGLAEAEAEVRTELDSGTLTLGRRIEKLAQLQAIEEARGTRKITDLPLEQQIALFRQGLGSATTFAASLQGLQDAEGKLAAEVQAAEPGSVRRLQLEQQIYELRATLGAQSLETQIALLATALKSDETRAEAIRELIILEKRLAEIRNNPRTTPAAREAATQAGNQVQGALGTAPAGEVAATRAQPDLTPAPGQPVIVAAATGEETIGRLEHQTESVHNMLARIGEDLPPVVIPFDEDVVRTFFDNLDAFAQGTAEGIVSTFEDVFGKLASGAENVGQALGSLGKGLAHSILSELSKMARGKVVENIASAIEEHAKAAAAAATGNFPGAAAHNVAAVNFLHAAATWGLVAAVSGAGSALTGGSGGGGRGGDRGSDRRAEQQSSQNQPRPATITIRGGVLDTDNVEQMDALAKAIGSISDRDVVVVRGR